jgi:hypothetical protein
LLLEMGKEYMLYVGCIWASQESRVTTWVHAWLGSADNRMVSLEDNFERVMRGVSEECYVVLL